MKVVQINATCGTGSTGKICIDVSKLLAENNIENYIFYSFGQSDYPLGIKYNSDKYIKLQALKSKVFGNYGFNSFAATKKLIKYLEKIKPDVIHLHNLHTHNVNLKMLFKYFKENLHIKLFWTFHDYWAFTGYCPYFEMAGCEKWKIGCECCVQRKSFSWLFDKSSSLYKQKKDLFSGLNLTIIAPSNYIANITKQSFFQSYEMVVIHNGIDQDIFKPTESNFREKHGLQDKKIVLGVAFGWGERKGLDVFIELSKRLPKEYQIVLVGTNNKIDKLLPSNIISVHRTEDKKELAGLYTMADVFVNPTRDEVFGLVNVEALACGTPVITFNTGGSSECIDKACGRVVPKEDINALEKAIMEVGEEQLFKKEDCIEWAKRFNSKSQCGEYINLYHQSNK